MTDLIMQYAAPASATRPAPEALFTNRFIGGIQLTEAEWKTLQSGTREFPDLLKGGAA